MINLKDSLFTDIMPENLASQLEVRAFAYAVGRQVAKLCAAADLVRIYSAVDELPERVLDIVAVELQTPAYNEKFSIEVKRKLVKGTLTFYAKMGTPAACNQIIETIFGVGYVEEWFSYNGEPHHFRAYVGQDGGQVDPGDLEEFRRVLGSVKRLSSWLDDIITIASFAPEILTFTARMGRGYMETSLPQMEKDYGLETVADVRGGFASILSTTLPEVGVDLAAIFSPRGAFGTVTTTAMRAAEE